MNSERDIPKKIRFLKETAYNSEGDIVKVAHWVEPDGDNPGEVYYYDSLGRYCYLLLTEENDAFARVKPRKKS